jgi:HK97 gp10 family phage protein
VDVRHARELAASLRDTFPNAVDTGVREAVQVVGERMVGDARKFVPVRTGFLLSTIALDQPAGAKWAFSLLARAPYSAYVEWGTSRMQARLFMTRAVELHSVEMMEEVENAVVRAARESLG